MPSSFYLSQFAADKNDGMCRSGQTRRSGRGVAVGGQCGLPDAGQPVEFADLLVEDPGGGEAAQHAGFSNGLEAMNRRSRRGHHIDPIYSLGLPPNRPAPSARAYVSRFNRGSSPVASVVAMYSSIRL